MNESLQCQKPARHSHSWSGTALLGSEGARGQHPHAHFVQHGRDRREPDGAQDSSYQPWLLLASGRVSHGTRALCLSNKKETERSEATAASTDRLPGGSVTEARERRESSAELTAVRREGHSAQKHQGDARGHTGGKSQQVGPWQARAPHRRGWNWETK